MPEEREIQLLSIAFDDYPNIFIKKHVIPIFQSLMNDILGNVLSINIFLGQKYA